MASDELGSLSQKARTGSLRSARIAMFVVGVLTLGANLFFALSAEKMVDMELNREIAELRKSGMEIDQEKLKPLRESAIRATELSSFVFVGVGAVFLLLGIFIYRAPVPCTVTALVLFLGGWIVTVGMAAADADGKDVAKAIGSGLIIKIIIIVCLGKAVQAAIAYQKESRTRRDNFDDAALENG